MDAGASHRSRVPPTASARRNRSDANKSRAATDAEEASVSHRSVSSPSASRPSVSHLVDDNITYLLAEGVEANEGPILGALENPSLLVSYNTHVDVAIWNGQVLQNPLIIFIYYYF